jgi:hypothetical protein
VVLREHRDVDVADPEDIPGLEDRALDLPPVHREAVRRSGVPDDQAVGERLDDGMAPRRLRVVQDEIADRVAADDGDGDVEDHVVHRAAWIADRESHWANRRKRRKTARL